MGITRAEIEAAKTPRGAWTKKQLAEWGVPWPPPKGWIERLVGDEPPLPKPAFVSRTKFPFEATINGRLAIVSRNAYGIQIDYPTGGPDDPQDVQPDLR